MSSLTGAAKMEGSQDRFAVSPVGAGGQTNLVEEDAADMEGSQGRADADGQTFFLEEDSVISVQSKQEDSLELASSQSPA